MDCNPSYYHPNDQNGEYFAGKLNGAWRVRVVPKKDIAVPNYIVVGREKVQGKVVYTNKSTFRTQQCSNCYGEDHLMYELSCPGVKKWGIYCKEFETRWHRAMQVINETVEEQGRNERPYFRLNQVNQELNAALEEKISEGARTVKEAEEMKSEMMKEIEKLKRDRKEDQEKMEESQKEREEIGQEVKRLQMVEREVQNLKRNEERLLTEMANLREKVQEAERKLKEEEEIREQLEQDGEILAQAVQSAAALENMLDGVENKDEANRSLSADLDPMDRDSENEKLDIEEESAAEVFETNTEEEQEKKKEGDFSKRPISSPEEENGNKTKINKLGLPEVTDKVWVKSSETNEIENFEIISLRDPLDPEKVRFNCRKLNDEDKRTVEVNFVKNEWGYMTPSGEQESPQYFYGYNTPKKIDLPPIPPRGPGNRDRHKNKSVIQRMNSNNKLDK